MAADLGWLELSGLGSTLVCRFVTFPRAARCGSPRATWREVARFLGESPEATGVDLSARLRAVGADAASACPVVDVLGEQTRSHARFAGDEFNDRIDAGIVLSHDRSHMQ